MLFKNNYFIINLIFPKQNVLLCALKIRLFNLEHFLYRPLILCENNFENNRTDSIYFK